jgi:hypothetical protein
MKLELTILKHLSSCDKGQFIDITFLHDDYASVVKAVDELKGKNLIVIDEFKKRDLEEFGISNQRVRSIRAKIKMNGRVYLHSMQSINKLKNDIKDSRRRWNVSHMLNF